MSEMSVTEITTRSYRFSGYKPLRDLNNNIIVPFHHIYQPTYWKTRALSGPDHIRILPPTNGK